MVFAQEKQGQNMHLLWARRKYVSEYYRPNNDLLKNRWERWSFSDLADFLLGLPVWKKGESEDLFAQWKEVLDIFREDLRH